MTEKVDLNPNRMVRLAACAFVVAAMHCSAWRSYAEEEQKAEEPTAEADLLFDDVGSDLDQQGQGFPDPLEGLNRHTLVLNQGIDRFVLDPLVTVYRFLVPDPGRRAVKRVLLNLNTPAILVNDLLQFEIHDAGVTTARFLVNTTVGIGGIFDIGEEIGLPGHRSDFGQTLARFGVGSGPFLIVPVIGPTTLRDGTGSLVDFLFRPTTYFLPVSDQVVVTAFHGGGTGLAEWDEQGDNLDRLEESSIDFYAALRSAYYQNRMAEIRARDDDDIAPRLRVAAAE